MADYVYPRAVASDVAGTADPASVAAALIAAREAGRTRLVARLEALAGNDDVATVDAVDREIEEERRALEGLDPVKYTTKTAFTSDAGKLCKWLSATNWANGLLVKYECSTWPQLLEQLGAKQMVP